MVDFFGGGPHPIEWREEIRKNRCRVQDYECYAARPEHHVVLQLLFHVPAIAGVISDKLLGFNLQDSAVGAGERDLPPQQVCPGHDK